MKTLLIVLGLLLSGCGGESFTRPVSDDVAASEEPGFLDCSGPSVVATGWDGVSQLIVIPAIGAGVLGLSRLDLNGWQIQATTKSYPHTSDALEISFPSLVNDDVLEAEFTGSVRECWLNIAGVVPTGAHWIATTN